jgi:hypothetical protein
VPRLLTIAVTMFLLIACGNVAGRSSSGPAADGVSGDRIRASALRVERSSGRWCWRVAEVVGAYAGLLGVFVAQLLARSANLVRPRSRCRTWICGRSRVLTSPS